VAVLPPVDSGSAALLSMGLEETCDTCGACTAATKTAAAAGAAGRPAVGGRVRGSRSACLLEGSSLQAEYRKDRTGLGAQHRNLAPARSRLDMLSKLRR